MAVSRCNSTHTDLIQFPVQKVYMEGVAPQGPSAAADAASQDPGAECTRNWTWCSFSRDLPEATLTLPLSLFPAAMRHGHGVSPRAGRRKGEVTGTLTRERSAWGLWQPSTSNTDPREGLFAVEVGSHLSDTGVFYLFSCLSVLTAGPYAGLLAALGTRGAVCLWSDGRWLHSCGELAQRCTLRCWLCFPIAQGTSFHHKPVLAMALCPTECHKGSLLQRTGLSGFRYWPPWNA